MIVRSKERAKEGLGIASYKKGPAERTGIGGRMSWRGGRGRRVGPAVKRLLRGLADRETQECGRGELAWQGGESRVRAPSICSSSPQRPDSLK